MTEPCASGGVNSAIRRRTNAALTDARSEMGRARRLVRAADRRHQRSCEALQALIAEFEAKGPRGAEVTVGP